MAPLDHFIQRILFSFSHYFYTAIPQVSYITGKSYRLGCLLCRVSEEDTLYHAADI